MKTAIFSLTPGGQRLADTIQTASGTPILPSEGHLASAVAKAWPAYDGFILIMAAGIAVRTIAPLLRDKRRDPCVVVLDETGRFAVSLLSGHLGGGNQLARDLAILLNGQAVITTASDTLGLTPIDLWAEHNGLVLEQGSLTALASRLVRTGTIRVFAEQVTGPLPPDLFPVESPEEADCIISGRIRRFPDAAVLFRPPCLVAGIGCNRGTSREVIAEAVEDACRRLDLAPNAIGRLATIDLKQDERGLRDYAEARHLPLSFFTPEELNAVPNVTRSEIVHRATGAWAVAEPAALLASGNRTLLAEKLRHPDVTIALAEMPCLLADVC